jgi:uncharacterized protein HemY
LSLTSDTAHRDAAVTRLGSLYLSKENYAAAKGMFLQACASRPTPGTWLGVGIACYRLGELAEAEQALAESNIYDSNEPDVCVWFA